MARENGIFTFSRVEHALTWYYRNLARFNTARAPAPGPARVQGGIDHRMDAHAEVMSIARCMRGLARWEREILRLYYEGHASLVTIQVFLDMSFPTGVQWRPRPGALWQLRKHFDPHWIARARREAERKVERKMEEKGILE